ncbi:MAG: hypothetical protein SPF47_02835 [Gemmiger sp.]|nr:hypothetical protein [Gemmiger sp.]
MVSKGCGNAIFCAIRALSRKMLTDEALKTIDTNGRRIFLSGEFGVTGITSDELHLCHHRMGTNPLEIIDADRN